MRIITCSSYYSTPEDNTHWCFATTNIVEVVDYITDQLNDMELVDAMDYMTILAELNRDWNNVDLSEDSYQVRRYQWTHPTEGVAVCLEVMVHIELLR